MITRGQHPCGRDHNRIRQLAFRAVTRMARSTGCLCAVPTVLGQRPLLGGFDPSGLVAEDDHDVPAYSVEVLRQLGYRVLEAHDRLSALHLPEWQKARVDLLFSGVVLASGLTGPQLVEAARALRPRLKVLFTTGYA